MPWLFTRISVSGSLRIWREGRCCQVRIIFCSGQWWIQIQIQKFFIASYLNHIHFIVTFRRWINVDSNSTGCHCIRFIWCPFYDNMVTWWRHQMETFFALLALCAGNSLVPGEFPAQRPVTRSFDVFFDLCPNKRLSKQWWGWWFETPLCPLWRHYNAKACLLNGNAIPRYCHDHYNENPYTRIAGVGFTELISSIALFFRFFTFVKTLVAY